MEKFQTCHKALFIHEYVSLKHLSESFRNHVPSIKSFHMRIINRGAERRRIVINNCQLKHNIYKIKINKIEIFYKKRYRDIKKMYLFNDFAKITNNYISFDGKMTKHYFDHNKDNRFSCTNLFFRLKYLKFYNKNAFNMKTSLYH